jgi:predicted AAA+ superfamily ATPase
MLTGNNRVRGDVFDESLDERMAPSLGGVVLGKEHEMYMNPEQFFQRTLITEQVADILGNIINVLKGESGRKILVLNALYGGGKTHTLLTMYHALKSPHTLLNASPENEEVRARINRFIEEAGRLGKPDLIIIDGYYSELAPSPISPLDVKAYRVRTLWGYIAHMLGSYSILREYDERQIAPEADKLLKILENRSVIILIDELAHYIKRFYETPDESIRKYSSAIENFMEVLAVAIEIVGKIVLIISLPAERREREGITVEITYQSIRQSIERIFKALGRVYTEYIEPIAPKNIPALLRTRLFEEIDGRRARDVYDTLSKTYDENREIFGQIAWMGDILRTYPFHPLYINTLIDILSKHEGLHKARDLLRINRKILREVIHDGKLYDLIMPWHIDLTKDPIRNTLLVGDYEGFKPVVEEDINERTRMFMDKPLLARITALTLLARTFVYGGGLVPKVEVFPLEKDLAQMIYEPATFQTEGWMLKDIVDSIRWVSGNLLYAVRDEKTGRLWFTRYVTPIKYVEERARKVDDMLAVNKVLEYSNKLLTETADLARRRMLRVTPKVFSAELSKALKTCEPIDTDTRKYILLACLNIPEREDERKAVLEEVLYRTRSGGTRGYANTIYVAFPSSQERIKWASDYAKKLIACDEVEEEGIIEKLTGALRGADAEIAGEILKRKLESYRTEVLNNLINNTLGIFNKIAYPHYDEEKLANTVKEVEFIVQADSIITAAERSLSSTGIGKLKMEIDFDTLDYYLRRVGIDLSDGAEPKTVETVVNYFYSNPRLPAAPRETILDAVRDGVRRLRFGVKSRGRIYFKKIYEDKAPPISEGEVVPMLNDGDEILPWRIALQEQMKGLKRQEWIEKEMRKIEEYIVRINDKELTVEEVLSNIGKFELEQLKTAPIIKVIRTVSIRVELAKQVVEVKPGEPVSMEAYITRIGPYVGEILLKPSNGRIDKQKLKVDDAFIRERITWTIDKIPQLPGEYSYMLEAFDLQGAPLDTVKLVVRVLGEKPGWREGIPPVGIGIGELEIRIDERFSVRPLDILRRRLGGAAIVSKANFKILMKPGEGRESLVVLDVQNVQIDDLLTLVMAVINRFQLFRVTASLSLSLKPVKEEFFIMPEVTDEERKVLGEHKIRYFEKIAG